MITICNTNQEINQAGDKNPSLWEIKSTKVYKKSDSISKFDILYFSYFPFKIYLIQKLSHSKFISFKIYLIQKLLSWHNKKIYWLYKEWI